MFMARSCSGVDPIKGRGADVSFAQGVAVGRVADVLAEALLGRCPCGRRGWRGVGCRAPW